MPEPIYLTNSAPPNFCGTHCSDHNRRIGRPRAADVLIDIEGRIQAPLPPLEFPRITVLGVDVDERAEYGDRLKRLWNNCYYLTKNH